MTEETKQQIVAMLPRLRRFAYGLAGNISDADDLLQEACSRAIGNLSSWEPNTRLDSWMYRIINNIWLDSKRHQGVRQRNARDLEDYMSQQVDEAKQIEDRMTLAAVRSAIDQLPEDQRIVLVMVCLEHMPYKEVAATLDLPIGTVMSRLSRGRKNLHRLISSQGDAEAADSGRMNPTSAEGGQS